MGVPLSADPCSSVEVLKSQVAASCGVPEDEQSLTFGGRVLDSSELLGAIGLGDESTVFLNLELEGGGKKRKKKTYTKPKKVKLAVLKFYKVDSNDKVTRLRRECPHELCGP